MGNICGCQEKAKEEYVPTAQASAHTLAVKLPPPVTNQTQAVTAEEDGAPVQQAAPDFSTNMIPLASSKMTDPAEAVVQKEEDESAGQ